MAVQKGNAGIIKIGSNALGEMRSYSIEHNSDTIESSSMGSTFKTYETGLIDGLVECSFSVQGKSALTTTTS